MANVFLSYRRGDIGWMTSIYREFDRKKYSDIKVFRDIEHIPEGTDFSERLKNEIDKSDVILVLVADVWEERAEKGDLNDPKDWVRKELLYAIKQQKLLLPLFIEDKSFPKLASEFDELTGKEGARIHSLTIDDDIDKLAKTLRELSQQEHERRLTAKLNGIRGVLKLAFRKLSTVSPLSEQDVRELDEWLKPELFINQNDELPPSLKSRGFRAAKRSHSELLIKGMSYKSIQFKNKMHFQIGISQEEEPRRVVTVYEQLQANGKVRMVIAAFHNPESSNKYDEIFRLLGEPDTVAMSDYRLPYNSIFFCQIVEVNRFMQTFFPYGNDKGVDSEIFAKLFELNWIGSKPLEKNTLQEIHSQMIIDFEGYEIIHAMEYPAPKLP